MSNTEHFIPGKDAPLETSINRLRGVLGADFEASANRLALHKPPRNCRNPDTADKSQSERLARKYQAALAFKLSSAHDGSDAHQPAVPSLLKHHDPGGFSDGRAEIK